MFSSHLMFYIIFFVVLFTVSFKLGREWERVTQEEQKQREPIRNIGSKW